MVAGVWASAVCKSFAVPVAMAACAKGLTGACAPLLQELLAGGDDGLADGLAGPDGAYDEWRRLYGAEWARWYGLQVRPSPLSTA